MRVLAIASYGALGGGEIAMSDFVAHRPAGVEVGALLVEDGPLRGRLEALGIVTEPPVADFDGPPGPGTIARFSGQLLRRLRRDRPDIVWANGLKAATMAVPACRLTRTPLVWHKVDFSLDGRIARPLARAVNGVIGVSNAVLEALGPLRARRALGVVGVPVRLPADARVEPASDPPGIGTMGTLIPIKGHEHIVRAGAALSAAHPDLRVILAGLDSPDFPGERDRLRALGDELGLGDRLELPGFCEPLDVLRRLTVFVTATQRDEHGYGGEGLGAALIEAQWVGLPVVAVAEGGAAEAFVDGTTGTGVAAPDGAAIAAAAAPYLDDDRLAVRTGEAGRAYAREHFAPDVAAGRLFALLEGAAR